MQQALVCVMPVCRAQDILPKIATSITSRWQNMHTLLHTSKLSFRLLCGGLSALAKLQRFRCPQIIRHKLVLAEPSAFCMLCTGHPCYNCSEDWSSYHHEYFADMKVEIVFFRSEGFCYFLHLLVTLANAITFYASQHHCT
jgi:hypothetical protein